jgi:pimeloyl-ACP methyl ester carboxylesterase
MRAMGMKEIILIFLMVAAMASASAGEVQVRMANNVTASAQYLPGEQGMTAVLVLHGITTTRNFGTVQSIVTEFASEGYTVLAPTLSMNINDRRANVPCDAIHTSTMQDDIAEVAFWVEWLAKQGHQRIALIGHSMGSLQLVAYAANHPHMNVTQVIATSLIHTHRYTEPEIIKRETEMALAAQGQTPPTIQGYHLVFCDAYIAPPEVYLSYMEWESGRVIDALRNTRVPVRVIMGEKDRRFGPEWIALLREAGSQVTVIEGASHFFDSTHEFDLLEQISEALQ